LESIGSIRKFIKVIRYIKRKSSTFGGAKS